MMNEEQKTPATTPKRALVHAAVAQANRPSDYWVLAAGVVVSLGLVGLTLFTSLGTWLYGEEALESYAEEEALSPAEDFWFTLIGYGILIAILLAVILTIVRMMRQQMLGNALQVEYSDYAWLREWSNQVARDLDMPRVEIMVTQDPVINAYAFGFAKPYTIVLHSGAIRWLTREQLKAVVVHEMAHVKYRHTQIGTYLGMLQFIPIIGSINSWILGFWSRRAELTADRLALCYLRDAEQVKSSLIGVHVGPDVAKSFNEVARQWQVYMADNYFNRFTQTFSSHPFLVRRLQHLDTMDTRFKPTWPPKRTAAKEEA